MSLIRKYKISKISNTPLNKEDLDAFNHYDSIFSNLEKHKKNDSSNSIYYLNSKRKLILEYEFNFKGESILWVNHNIVLFKTRFDLSNELRETIEYFVDKHVKIQSTNIRLLNNSNIIKLLEEEFSKKN